MIPKSPRWECKSLTNLAKHYDCQHCGEHGMSIAAHSNQQEHGKGMGNVVKYVSRWRSKNGVEDLKKARHYLDMLIESQEVKA